MKTMAVPAGTAAFFVSSSSSSRRPSSFIRRISLVVLMIAILLLVGSVDRVESFLSSSSSCVRRDAVSVRIVRQQAKAGSYFNPIPNNNNNDDNDNDDNEDKDNDNNQQQQQQQEQQDEKSSSSLFDDSIADLLKSRKSPSLASTPSTINGIPTAEVTTGAGMGFEVMKKKSDGTKNKKTKKQKEPQPQKKTKKKIQQSVVELGPKFNDVTNPEYDDQGYTLYADEETGTKSRVFEALVEYPCEFTMKIIGAKEGSFVEEMVALVAESCRVQDVSSIEYAVKSTGKWCSVTVQAPVQSAEMLYQLYENVDRDPRVKFKF